MKKNYLSSFFLVLVFTALLMIIGNKDARAQIKIGNNGTNIAPASLLELESTDKGLLIPRMANTTAIDALNPPVGMLIYITTEPSGIYIKKTAGWEYLTGFLGGNAFFNSVTVTGQVTAGNFTGPLNGNATSANTATNATNTINAAIINDLSTPQPVYPTFVLTTPGNSQLRTSTTKLSFIPNTGILTATGFNGPLTGDVTGNATSATNATNASNTDILDEVASAAVHYPTFVTATSGNLPHLVSSAGFNYIPATGTLSATQFSGSLLGNASTATLSANATNAVNVGVINDASSTGFNFPVFVGATAGNQALKTGDAGLRYRPSTGELFAGTFIGPLTGNVTGSATSATNATNATNIAVTADASATPMYPTFVAASAGTLPARANTVLTFLPSTGTLTSTRFSGIFDGNATTATSAVTTTITNDNTSGAVAYPTFVASSSGNMGQRTADAKLTFVPATGNLTTTSYTSTVADGTAPLVVASSTPVANLTSTNTLNTNITDDVASTTPTYPTFVGVTSGYQNQRTASSRLSFVPATGALTAGSFVGPLTGNAATASTATLTTITDDLTTATTTYPTFVTANTGNQGQRTSSSRLSFVPATGALTANSFTSTVVSGTAPFVVASTTAVANLTSTNANNAQITDDVATAVSVYPTFVTSNTGYQNQRTASSRLSFVPSTGALSASSFVGPLSGNATTATTATTATNSINSAITNDVSNTSFAFPVFADAASGNQALKTGNALLRYRPSSGELFAGTFVGPLTGNAATSTNSTNATNIAIAPDVTGATMYPTFVTGTAGPLSAKVNTGLSFIPSTGTLTTNVFSGNLQGNATTATQVTSTVPATLGGTGQSSYLIGNMLYASTPTTLDKIPPGANGQVLTMGPSPTFVPYWSSAGSGTVTSVAGTADIVITGTPTVAPIVGISNAFAGRTSITTLGTISTGTWNADDIPITSGGTGVSALPTGLLYGNGTAPITSITGPTGYVLTSTGAGTAPVYQASGGGDMILSATQTVTGPKTFGLNNLIVTGTGGRLTTLLGSPGAGAATVTLPVNGTIVNRDAVETLDNKTLNSPILVTPNIGAATGTSLTTAGNVTGQRLESTIATGTAPLIINSTTPVPNLSILGNALTATTAVNFSGNLLGDVTGNQGSTVVSSVGGINATGPNSIAAGVNLANDATSNGTVSTIVRRDGDGNFTANDVILNDIAAANISLTGVLIGNVTGNLNGNATTATNAANVTGTVPIANGGTGQTTKVAAFNALSPMTTAGDIIYGGVAGSGTRLALGTAGQILRVGAGAPAWGAVNLATDVASSILSPTNGGTGINNGARTITVGGNFTTFGANDVTLRTAGVTDVTLPVTGTLQAALNGTGSISFGPTDDGDSSDGLSTIAIADAADGDVVSLGVPNTSMLPGYTFTAWVSGPGVVSIRFTNTSGITATPPATTFKVKIFK